MPQNTENHKKKLVNNDFLKKQVEMALQERKKQISYEDFEQNEFFRPFREKISTNWSKLPKNLKKSIISINTNDKKLSFLNNSDESLLFFLMTNKAEDDAEITEGFLDSAKETIGGVGDFFKDAVRPAVNYVRNTSASEAVDDVKEFWKGVGRQTVNSTRNAIRWTKKKFYSNDQQMSISNIESNDEDIKFIKHFFALFGDLSFESGKFTSIFPNSLEIENPDNYSLYPEMSNDLDEWFSENRQDFIKECIEDEGISRRIDLTVDYLEDFFDEFEDSVSRLSFFGLGSKELMIDSSTAERIIKKIIESEEWAFEDLEAQISGSAPCILDVFPMFFRFLFDLDSRLGADMSRGNYQRVASRVLKYKSVSEFVEEEKDYLFLRFLRKNENFRKKWTGYCLNSTFDPDGKWPLSWWTDNAEAFKEKSKESKAQFYGKVFAKISGAIGRDAIALRSAQAIYQRATGVAASGWWTGLFIVVIVGVDLLISFDPGEWFSNRDDIEEELLKMRQTLEEVIDEVSSGDIDRKKLLGLKEKFAGCAQLIAKLIHNSMISGLQKNIEDPNQDMTIKKMVMFLLSDNITAIKQISNSLSLDPDVDLNVKNLKILKKQLDALVQEISKKEEDSTKGTKSVIDKIKPSLKQGIKSAENVFETKLLLENSFDTMFEEFKNKFIDLFNYELQGDGQDLAAARSIKARFNEKTKAGSRLSEIMADPDSAMINASARFERWWDHRTSGNEIKSDPKDTAEQTIYHTAWARTQNGQCSQNYAKNYFTIDSARMWQAWAAIGPGHGLANTCFLYVPYRAGPWKELRLRSKVQIENEKVYLINVGNKIQSIEGIIKKDFLKVNKNFINSEFQKVNNFVNMLVQKIDKLPHSKETNKLRAANILAHLYSKRFLEGSSSVYYQLNQIISLDKELTLRMIQKANTLAKLSPNQQNPNPTQGNLMSDLRKSAALKIMLFEALMDGII